jgi:hypothetical protein
MLSDGSFFLYYITTKTTKITIAAAITTAAATVSRADLAFCFMLFAMLQTSGAPEYEGKKEEELSSVTNFHHYSWVF